MAKPRNAPVTLQQLLVALHVTTVSWVRQKPAALYDALAVAVELSHALTRVDKATFKKTEFLYIVNGIYKVYPTMAPLPDSDVNDLWEYAQEVP